MAETKIWMQERTEGFFTFFSEGGKWKIGQKFTHNNDVFEITSQPFGGRVTSGGKPTYMIHFEAKKLPPENQL